MSEKTGTCAKCGKTMPLTVDNFVIGTTPLVCQRCYRPIANWGMATPPREGEYGGENVFWCHKCRKYLPATPDFMTKSGKCKRCEAARARASYNPEKSKEALARRRARERKAEGTVTAADIRQQLKSQKGLCWWCGKPLGEKYSVDHRVPLSRGGSNAPENIVITHLSCNLSKGAKMPGEYCGRLL